MTLHTGPSPELHTEQNTDYRTRRQNDFATDVERPPLSGESSIRIRLWQLGGPTTDFVLGPMCFKLHFLKFYLLLENILDYWKVTEKYKTDPINNRTCPDHARSLIASFLLLGDCRLL